VELAKLLRFLDPHQGDTLLKKVANICIRKQEKIAKHYALKNYKMSIYTTVTSTKHVLSSGMAIML
jgi:hypothetical protein